MAKAAATGTVAPPGLYLWLSQELRSARLTTACSRYATGTARLAAGQFRRRLRWC